MTTVAVLGLGEAGGRIAEDLVAAGATVRGFDPARSAAGIPTAASAAEAADGADVVLSVNAAAAALDAARAAADALRPDAVYADLNTASPELKRRLADRLAPVAFADVALLGVVPKTGLATPSLASGAGAGRFAELLGPLGMPVEVVGPRPGDAAAIKLLRSVFMKGLAAASLESLEAARAAGVEERVRADLASVIGEELLDRLLDGSRRHAVRRTAEMEAAAAYLDQLGTPADVSRAAGAWLRRLA